MTFTHILSKIALSVLIHDTKGGILSMASMNNKSNSFWFIIIIVLVIMMIGGCSGTNSSSSSRSSSYDRYYSNDEIHDFINSYDGW